MILKHINDIASVCAGQGVKTAIISPGSRSAPLTLAFNQHPDIDVKVIGDERSAAFIALGIAQQQKAPVVLICTSGSAVYNYAPAVAEAYFQEVPLLILSADRPPEWVGQYDGQTIRQSNILGSHVKASFDFPVDPQHPDAFWHANRITNEALIKCRSAPKGPIHINVPLREPFYPSDQEKIEFAEARIIEDHRLEPSLSEDSKAVLLSEWQKHPKRIIVIGQTELDLEEVHAISEFASQTDTVVINDVIGNHHLTSGVIQHQDAFLQPQNTAIEVLKPDLLITIGKSLISKNLKVFLRKNPPSVHWHVRNSDRLNDTLQHLTRAIQISPKRFFSDFKPAKDGNGTYRTKWMGFDKKAKKLTDDFLLDCPFGEFQAIANCLSAIPDNSQLHLANSMTVRYANLIGLDSNVEVFANRGTSGIDGSNGTAVGAALAQSKLVTLITGDMAFFYDRNSFWHHYDLSNLRVILLNNAGGGIFRMIKGPQDQPDYEKLFEVHQEMTAENTARDHGFTCESCNDLSELNNSLETFFEISEKPKIIEVFSDSKSNAGVFSEFKKALKSQFSDFGL